VRAQDRAFGKKRQQKQTHLRKMRKFGYAESVFGLLYWAKQSKEQFLPNWNMWTFLEKGYFMKIAVTSTGKDLDSQVDPRFGRAAYFIIVDTDTMESTAIENANVAAGGGAGINSAKAILDSGAQAVLTGNCGPNAQRTLSAGDIKLYTGLQGTVAQAIEQFKTGALKEATAANVEPHSGLNG
jgi:predicted Fe-Mo cluster-binding NifX family protein